MNYRLAARTNAARVLTVVGVVLIISFLVDFLFLLFPFLPTNGLWQIDLATALVERGIVPLVGLSLVFAGYWFDTIEDGSRPAIDLRFPAIILSSLLGLMFLLIFPIHLNNVRQASAQAVEQIDQKAQQQEDQIKNQLTQVQTQLSSEEGRDALEQKKSQLKTRYTDILEDEEQYQGVLNDPNASPLLKDLLKKFKENPQELDQYVEKQSDPQAFTDQQLSKIQRGKEVAETQTRYRAWKSGLRIAISSSLLSIGYIIIGWTGWVKSSEPNMNPQVMAESPATKGL